MAAPGDVRSFLQELTPAPFAYHGDFFRPVLIGTFTRTKMILIAVSMPISALKRFSAIRTYPRMVLPVSFTVCFP